MNDLNKQLVEIDEWEGPQICDNCGFSHWHHKGKCMGVQWTFPPDIADDLNELERLAGNLCKEDNLKYEMKHNPNTGYYVEFMNEVGHYRGCGHSSDSLAGALALAIIEAAK